MRESDSWFGFYYDFLWEEKPALQVIHCDCSLLLAENEENNSASGNHHRVWGDSITMVTEAATPSILCMAMKYFIFLEDGIKSCDLPLCCSLTYCWWFKMQRALIIPWTKSNHGGESSVDLWRMFEACTVSSLWRNWRKALWICLHINWVLGLKCLVCLKIKAWHFWEIRLVTFLLRARLMPHICALNMKL